MLAELRAADPKGAGLPRYVERELAAYRRCGILAHGFARVRCQACGDEIVVALSCKRRGIYSSCTARRMADTAADLVDSVLPCARGSSSSEDARRVVFPPERGAPMATAS